MISKGNHLTYLLLFVYDIAPRKLLLRNNIKKNVNILFTRSKLGKLYKFKNSVKNAGIFKLEQTNFRSL